MGDMQGRVALVTGGSSGIGLASALAFASRGAAVVIAARGAERGAVAVRRIRDTGGTTEFVQADVSRAEQVEALLRTVIARFGRLDYAFNNAASVEAGLFRSTAEFSDEEFDLSYRLNLRSVWLCMKYELLHMVEQGTGGAIVNTSSVNGLGGVRGAAPYAVAKAGILALTKSAAQEYAANGIRVNALVAGAFDTPMLRTAIDRHAEGDPERVKAAEEVYTSVTALGRIGKPEEAAEAVVWLCSDAASYVTGHSLIVDGGMTAWAR